MDEYIYERLFLASKPFTSAILRALALSKKERGDIDKDHLLSFSDVPVPVPATATALGVIPCIENGRSINSALKGVNNVQNNDTTKVTSFSLDSKNAKGEERNL